MDDVIEILDLPVLSNVPLTQPWVRGIANVRGSLLPVIDLNGYLGNEVPRVTNKTRVLVIDFNGVYSGLVVDALDGQRGIGHGLSPRSFESRDAAREWFRRPATSA